MRFYKLKDGFDSVLIVKTQTPNEVKILNRFASQHGKLTATIPRTKSFVHPYIRIKGRKS